MRRAWHQVAKPVRELYRTSVTGDVFDSGDELKRWTVLQFAERAGKVRNLRRQVRYPLILPNGIPIKIRSPHFPNGRSCNYTADFAYEEFDDKAGAWVAVVEERKSYDDPTSRLRRAVVEAIHGFHIRVTGQAAAKRARRRTATAAR